MDVIINPKVSLAKGQVNLFKDSYKKVATNTRANKALKLMDEVTGGLIHILDIVPQNQINGLLIELLEEFKLRQYIQRKHLLSF